MRNRESLDGLHPKALITRPEVAIIADVSLKSVTTWAQDEGLDPPFPSERRPQGARIADRQQKWYEIGEIVEWLCATGRLECGQTVGMVDLNGAAAGYGVSIESIMSWRRKEIFPEPDLILGRSPWWNVETLKTWTGRPTIGGNVRGHKTFKPPPGMRVKAARKNPVTSQKRGTR